MMSYNILDHIKKSAEKKILYLPHAVRQMSRLYRMISTADVREIIKHGEIIEDYPMDKRGHSCLIMGYDNENRPIHRCMFAKRGLSCYNHSIYSKFGGMGKGI